MGQRDFDSAFVTPSVEGIDRTGSKAPGSAQLTDADGTVAVAVRDFWQQWPKGSESDAHGLKIELLPTFSEGIFDHMGPWYKHQYLFERLQYQPASLVQGWPLQYLACFLRRSLSCLATSTAADPNSEHETNPKACLHRVQNGQVHALRRSVFTRPISN